MRILYVNDALAIWGGMERILVEKVNLLAEMFGYDMHVVTANQGSHPLPYTLSSRVHFQDLDISFHHSYHYKGLKRWLTWREKHALFQNKLKAYINAVCPDVIVCMRTELTSDILKSKGDIPLVFESHASRWAQRFNGYSMFEVLMSDLSNRRIKHADMVVALTRGDAADWRLLNPRVSVIPNVVHLNESGVYSSVSNKSVIFVGRYSHQKDIDSLIKIWQIVNSRHPDWTLNIYGGFGEEQQRLVSTINQLSINIVTHAPTPNIFSKYQENSVMVLTSRFEPFGLVLPEAMSYGLPVVAFDCPYGPAEIITDGVDGFLVGGRDIQLFADRVCLLIENFSLRQNMGLCAIHSSQRFAAERVMPLWKDLFEHLADERKH
jgi:glycosyltransferase involved in cell wall biosynthesis